MVRATLRFIGFWLLAAAVVAVVVDGTRSIADSTVSVTPLGQTWVQINTASLNAAQAFLQRYLNPAIWDQVVVTVLRMPTALVAGFLAALCLVLGRPKRDIFG